MDCLRSASNIEHKKGVERRVRNRLFKHTMLKGIRNLDYTIILCQDVAAMKHFYHGLLGFPIYRDFGEWVEMRVGASLLTLGRRGRGYEGVREQHGSAPLDGAASLQLAFRVTPAEVESCYTELQQKGIVILQPPTNQATRHRTLFFKDPENNLLEIYADL